MSKQSKKHSHYEVWTNQVVGILVGLVVMYHLLPILKEVPAVYASPITVFTMFFFSYIRAYIIRRVYNGIC